MAIIIRGDLEAPTAILLVRTRIKTSARMAIYVICARNWVKPTADVGLALNENLHLFRPHNIKREAFLLRNVAESLTVRLDCL